jgi:predicted acyltransferase (DUF342 family)
VYYQGSSFSSESPDPSRFEKTLIVNEDSEGEYLCVAQNYIVGPDVAEVGPTSVVRNIIVEIEGKISYNLLPLCHNCHHCIAESDEILTGEL